MALSLVHRYVLHFITGIHMIYTTCTHEISLAVLYHSYAFGFKHDVHTPAAYLDDSTAVYACGHSIIKLDTDTKRQDAIPCTPSAVGVSAIAVAPNKSCVKIAAAAPPPRLPPLAPAPQPIPSTGAWHGQNTLKLVGLLLPCMTPQNRLNEPGAVSHLPT